MPMVSVSRWDAFASRPGMGNPAGIVWDGGNWTPEQMQAIAAKVGFSETAFLCPSDSADLRLRYFTPGQEMDLCGHATIASIAGWMARQGEQGRRALTIETRAGVLQTEYDGATGEVTMTQADADFRPYPGQADQVAAALGLGVEDLDPELPIVYGSTGSWTLIVPIRGLEPFSRMRPDNARFPELMPQFPRASVHPSALATLYHDSGMHGRHFSSPFSGVVEDPVTGTASGVMGAYYLKYVRPDQPQADLLVEQGQEMGRDGLVHVWAQRSGSAIQVRIAGKAVAADELEVEF